MSNYKVYQTLVFHQPTAKKNEDEVEPTIIFPIETLIGKDVSAIERKLIRQLDAKWDDKLNEIIIVVRPF